MVGSWARVLSWRFGTKKRGERSAAIIWGAALAGSIAVGAVMIAQILERAGRPAAPLDDTFIHMQFARRLAEGAPFHYAIGAGPSTGSTSLLWPALLALFHRAGAHGLDLLYAAWGLGTIAHAGTAVAVGHLGARIAGAWGRAATMLMSLLFPPFAWFAWSGMETMLFAWTIAAIARHAVETWGSDRAHHRRALAFWAFIAPLARPEGAIIALIAAIVLSRRPRARPRISWGSVIALAGVTAQPIANYVISGDTTSATAHVKWLVYNPYFQGIRLAGAIGYHARLLITDVLQGGEWTWIFLPHGFGWILVAGAIAALFGLHRAPSAGRIATAIGLVALVTCTYQTFLWNRMRYVWPFFVGAPVLVLAAAQGAIRPFRAVLPATSALLSRAAPLFLLGIAIDLARFLPLTANDLAESASAVDRQQVTLGEWIAAEMPSDARIGVNDTGALTYLGERPTFDIVGLTTESEGRHWVAGAGSRFEHYEALAPEERPTHYAVYPEWFRVPDLLGPELRRATVTDHAILGGDTMVVYEADHELLGSGALPRVPPADRYLTDELDVADLDAEATHGYALLDAWDADNFVRVDWWPSGAPSERPFELADGGRDRRSRDTFSMHVARGAIALLVMRVSAEKSIQLRVRVNGVDAGTVEVEGGAWNERAVDLSAFSTGGSRPWTADASSPKKLGNPENLGGTEAALLRIDVAAPEGERFASFHYWLYAR